MQLSEHPRGRSYVPYTSLDELRNKTDALASRMHSSFERYYSTKLRLADLMDYLEFLPDGGEYYEAFLTPESSNDGFSLVAEAGKVIDEWYLLDRWSHGRDAGIFKGRISESFQDIWSMPIQARQDLMTKWKGNILGEQVSELREIAAQYNQTLNELERLRKRKDEQVIGSKRIVACTTT